jgi:pilus assembly protein CpaE
VFEREDTVPEKILIVDDDLESLKLIGLMLQRRGYTILAAQGGAQALSKAESEQPNLVILDVMMPDLDGYEVTRRMRANTKTSHIPIIMFTAKTLVGDKVAGFQAGADDYLTKPIHPAELASRVEAVLLRSSRARADGEGVSHARIIGMMGVKGGVGTTTLAINVGVAMAQMSSNETPKRVTVAELNSGAGDLAVQMGITRSGGLHTLLSRKTDDITSSALDKTLVTHVTGARFLVSPVEERALGHNIPPEYSEAIIKQLASLSDIVLLDLGSRIDDNVRAALSRCSRLVLALEPQRISVTLTRSLLAQLEKISFGIDKIALVVVNRTQSASSLSRGMLEGLLGQDIIAIVPPAPEVAFQAADQGEPIIMVQPGNIVSDQFRELARFLLMGPVV